MREEIAGIVKAKCAPVALNDAERITAADEFLVILPARLTAVRAGAVRAAVGRAAADAGSGRVRVQLGCSGGADEFHVIGSASVDFAGVTSSTRKTLSTAVGEM